MTLQDMSGEVEVHSHSYRIVKNCSVCHNSLSSKLKLKCCVEVSKANNKVFVTSLSSFKSISNSE